MGELNISVITNYICDLVPNALKRRLNGWPKRRSNQLECV